MRFFSLLVFLVVGVGAHEQTLEWAALQGKHSSQTLERALSAGPFRHEAVVEGDTGVTLSSSVESIDDGGAVTINALFADDTAAPTEYDWITITCGESSGSGDYLDLVTVTVASASASASASFSNLVFLRCDYEFNYYSNSSAAYVASLRVPSTEPPTTPKQLHLSFPGTPSEMTVQYISSTDKPAPSVRLTSPAAAAVQGTSATYSAEDLCESPANTTSQQYFRDPGFIHTVKLSGLTPNTVYEYQAGNDEHGWSTPRTFRTAPEVGANNGVRFVAFGDQDVGNAARNTSNGVTFEVTERDASFVLHFGDLGYALGKGYIWDKWGTLVEDGASRVPYMVSCGNHEFDHLYGEDPSGEIPFMRERIFWNNGKHASNGECGVPIYHRHAGATASEGNNGIFWYSFDYGNLHVVQFSSEHDFTERSHQWNWLKQDLSAVDRSLTPWVIVTMHRPIYTTQLGEPGDFLTGLQIREALDPLFHEFEVNLALVAHTHSYERTCPVYKGSCVPEGEGGTTHITVGSAGAGLEGKGYSPLFGDFSEAHINTWGYLRVDSSSSAGLKLEFVLDSNGTVWDSATVAPWPQ